MMSVQVPHQQINTIREIVEDPNIVPFTPVGFIYHSILEESDEDSLFHRLLEKMISMDGLIPISKMLNEEPWRMCAEEKAAILLPKSVIDLMLHRLYMTNPDRYREVFRFIDELFQSMLPVLLAYPKTMELRLREAFNQNILWYVSTGKFRDSINRAVVNAEKCYSYVASVNSDSSAMSVKETEGVFLCMSIGLVISSVVLVLERIFLYHTILLRRMMVSKNSCQSAFRRSMRHPVSTASQEVRTRSYKRFVFSCSARSVLLRYISHRSRVDHHEKMRPGKDAAARFTHNL